MSGRGRGRGGRSGRGNRSMGNQQAQTTNRKEFKTQPKKTLSDYVYYIGSAKQASDFVVPTQYIINHVRKTFTNGDDIGDALKARQEVDMLQFMPTLNVSDDPDADIKEHENKQFEILYEAEIQEFVARKRMYETNKGKAYALIFSQCNKALQNKLMSRTDFETADKGKPIELLDAIEKHAMSYMEHKYDAAVVLDSFRNLINLKQKEDEDLIDYTRRFKSARDVDN